LRQRAAQQTHRGFNRIKCWLEMLFGERFLRLSLQGG
jgi:hypothetical protein